MVVFLFAVTWIPYRGLLVYNSFVKEPAWDRVYLFFAKTCVYFNCAMNPYLYNLSSRRFRSSVYLTLCRPKSEHIDRNTDLI